MGIDFLDLCIRIQREFNLSRHQLPLDILDASRSKRGTLKGVTAADISRWVTTSLTAHTAEVPQDLWPRLRTCIAATVLLSEDQVLPASRLIEDLGFT